MKLAHFSPLTLAGLRMAVPAAVTVLLAACVTPPPRAVAVPATTGRTSTHCSGTIPDRRECNLRGARIGWRSRPCHYSRQFRNEDG